MSTTKEQQARAAYVIGLYSSDGSLKTLSDHVALDMAFMVRELCEQITAIRADIAAGRDSILFRAEGDDT